MRPLPVLMLLLLPMGNSDGWWRKELESTLPLYFLRGDEAGQNGVTFGAPVQRSPASRDDSNPTVPTLCILMVHARVVLLSSKMLSSHESTRVSTLNDLAIVDRKSC